MIHANNNDTHKHTNKYKKTYIHDGTVTHIHKHNDTYKHRQTQTNTDDDLRTYTLDPLVRRCTLRLK